uniref:glycosyltransferase family 39 protein n=1 Tax=Prevotella sp. TaxID=59823 RepID=UPI0040290755
MQSSYCKISIAFFFFLLAILLFVGYTPTNDGDGYIDYALMSLKDGQPYPSHSTILGQPFIWNIGQINLIALSLWLTRSIVPVLVLMCALKAATAYVVARIAELLFNHRTGLIAILLYIAYPNNWGQSTMLLSEIPSVALALTALYLTLKYNRAKTWIAAGLLFAIATWIHPISPIYIGSALLYHLFFNRKQIFRRYACVIGGYAALLIAVGTSCYLRTGYFLTQPTTVWFNFVANTYEKSTKVDYTQPVYPKGTARCIANREKLTALQCRDIWRQRSLQWLGNHKIAYLKKVPGRLFWMYYEDIDNIAAFLKDKQHAENNYVTLPVTSMAHQINSLSPIQYFALINEIFYLIIVLMAVTETVQLLRKRDDCSLFLPLFIIVAGSLALVLVSHGETRFKAPFIPFLFMLAASVSIKMRNT